MIAKIATGEIEDITTDDGKNAAAVALGQGRRGYTGIDIAPTAQVARHK